MSPGKWPVENCLILREKLQEVVWRGFTQAALDFIEFGGPLLYGPQMCTFVLLS